MTDTQTVASLGISIDPPCATAACIQTNGQLQNLLTTVAPDQLAGDEGEQVRQLLADVHDALAELDAPVATRSVVALPSQFSAALRSTLLPDTYQAVSARQSELECFVQSERFSNDITVIVVEIGESDCSAALFV